MSMLSWQEVQQQFRNEWVAMLVWEEDAHGDVQRGEVAYHHKDQKAFYAHLKRHYPQHDLAIRYTGPVRGPFFLGA